MEEIEFTEEEMLFLFNMGLSASDFFNAQWMTKVQRDTYGKSIGKLFMVGSRCKRGWHRLRARSGHCIQCNTDKIAFIKRHYEYGRVYIAGSLETELLKIGCTASFDVRDRRLSDETYAGATDWEILFWVTGPKQGVIETRTHRLLDYYRTYRRYHDGKSSHVAQEAFSCPYSVAKDAMLEAIDGEDAYYTNEFYVDNSEYEFD